MFIYFWNLQIMLKMSEINFKILLTYEYCFHHMLSRKTSLKFLTDQNDFVWRFKNSKIVLRENMLWKAQSHAIVPYFTSIIALDYQGSVTLLEMFRFKVYFENAKVLCILIFISNHVHLTFEESVKLIISISIISGFSFNYCLAT